MSVGRAPLGPIRTSRPYSGAVATEAFESSRASSGLRTLVDRNAVGALILAGSIPFLFLHERYQPEASVRRPEDARVLGNASVATAPL